MTIHHHPPEELLTAFAAGLLDLGQHVAVATHLVGCAHCREAVRTMEHVGGAVLTGLPPTAMSAGALAGVEARLDRLVPATALPPRHAAGLADVPGLPPFVREYTAGPWRWIAPKVHLRSDSAARSEPDAGLSVAITAGYENDRAYPHRFRNELRAVGKLCSCRRDISGRAISISVTARTTTRS